MNSQNDKEGSGHVKAAIIGGVFALVAACIGGSFLILNTLVNNGVIVVGISNPNSRPTETPIVESATEAIQQTSVPIVTSNNSTNRPSPIHIVNGNNYSMPAGWFWVCTGDFSTEISGIKKAWYDVGVSNTGLVFVLQPDTTFTISGAFEISAGKNVGDCSPYAQNEKDSAITSAINAQFDRGCNSKCQYVNVIELDKNGNEVSNYWTPQKP